MPDTAINAAPGHTGRCHLFSAFFLAGLFACGGYAVLPMLEREVIENHGRLTTDQFLGILTIAEITPGPLTVNIANFAGFRTGGIPGALIFAWTEQP